MQPSDGLGQKGTKELDGSIKNKVFNGAVIIAIVGIIAKLTSFAQDAVLAAYIGGFVITWFFGVDEKRIEEIYG